MSASNAFAGVGASFWRSNMLSSGGTFARIAEINNISGISKSRDTIDVTNLDSTGGYKEFIAGFRDAGQVVLDMNFTLDGFDDFNADFEASDAREYRIMLPDSNATQFDFSGLVVGLDGPKIAANDKVTMSVTIKITGAVTLRS